MGSANSLDNFTVIAALLRDAQRRHGDVFSNRALRLTIQKVERRIACEGVSFLTKTMYNLGRHFDKVLAGACSFEPSKCGFKTRNSTSLPVFLGELFERVLSTEGVLLHSPDALSVRTIRQILLPFGKYELEYPQHIEQKVINDFKKAEDELAANDGKFETIHNSLQLCIGGRIPVYPSGVFGSLSSDTDPSSKQVLSHVRRAKQLLFRVVNRCDFTNIVPRHGPGVVATKQRFREKYQWSNVSTRITDVYPLDAYFYASLGHVCDKYDSFDGITGYDLPAKVILVPKDSRGPRLISCEPVDKQWIQQGIMRNLVRSIEANPLTKGKVNFTDQTVNQTLAKQASLSGEFATLDLKEASDRVHHSLIRLLFPEHVFRVLDCCRSVATVLPAGDTIALRKFAPMGSALCFPIMALTIWALLSAAAPNAYVQQNIYVYGDDVIVPVSFANDAIAVLTYFGLKLNTDKCCIQGPFKESCGTDAFQGLDVTPVRFRTVWSSDRSPTTYCSWISYSNSLYAAGYVGTARAIADSLESVYGPIPSEDMNLSCPSLSINSRDEFRFKKRYSKRYQRFQYLVPDSYSPSHRVYGDDWDMILRFFSESPPSIPVPRLGRVDSILLGGSELDVRLYTTPRRMKIRKVWR